jgi:hypothetical protein
MFYRGSLTFLICCFLSGPAQAAIQIKPVGRATEILAPGRSFIWSIGTDQAGLMKWQVLGWNQEPLTSSRPLTLAKGEGLVSYFPTKLGWQELVITIRDSQGVILDEQSRGFVSGETRKLSPSDFKYGVCSHLAPGPFLAADLEVLDKLGVAYDRDDLRWDVIQPVSGPMHWGAFDILISEMAKRGISLDAILDYGTKWASTQPESDKWINLAPQEAPWLAFVHAAVARYKDQVHDWEIWNEPDTIFWQSSTAEYVALFNRSAQAIKEEDPAAQVINGGMGFVSREPNPDFLNGFLAGAQRTNWNIFAWHDYYTFADLLKHADQLKTLRSRYQLPPHIWMNEGGQTALGPEGEALQAVTLVKKWAAAPSLGEAYFLYDLKDDGTDPLNGEHHFGLVHQDHSAKPAFGACQTLLRLLGGRKYLGVLQLPKAGIWEYLYGARGGASDQMAVLWSESPSGLSQIQFDELKKAEVLDLMGNRISGLKNSAGTSSLDLGSEPIYIRAPATGDLHIQTLLKSSAP